MDYFWNHRKNTNTCFHEKPNYWLFSYLNDKRTTKYPAALPVTQPTRVGNVVLSNNDRSGKPECELWQQGVSVVLFFTSNVFLRGNIHFIPFNHFWWKGLRLWLSDVYY